MDGLGRDRGLVGGGVVADILYQGETKYCTILLGPGDREW